MREFVGAIDNTFHDLHRTGKFKDCLDPESYTASQKLERRHRSANSNGITYKSVRDPEGEVVATFRPNAVGLPVPGRHFAYHFDGERIGLVRDEESGDVWRFVYVGQRVTVLRRFRRFPGAAECVIAAIPHF